MGTDIRPQAWILTYAPRWLEPYCRLMRLDRPSGLYLILLPALWGLVSASFSGFSVQMILIFSLGAFLMRSAGCVLNDIVDQDFDVQVERTKTRPLASQELSFRQGVICLTLLLSLALFLLLHLNSITILLGFAAVFLVALYPFMKRFTYWPQLFLGLAMNWGILMAETTMTETLSLKGGLLFCVGIGWTLFYDTLYAHQDKKDDLLIGVKSSALKLHLHTKPFLRGILALKLIFLTAFIFWETGVDFLSSSLDSQSISSEALSKEALATGSLPISLFSSSLETPMLILSWGCLLGACGSLHFILKTTDLDSPSSCLKAFKRSQIFGWFVLAGLLVNKIPLWL